VSEAVPSTKKLAAAGALFATLAAAPAVGAHQPDGDRPGPFGRSLASVAPVFGGPADWVPADHDGLAPAKDQADTTSLPTVHLAYLHPSDQPSRFGDLAHMIQGEARRQSRMLTQLSGRALRFDERLDAAGRPLVDITVLRSRSTAKALGSGRQFSLVKDDLTRAGLTQANKKYLVWVDANSTICGQSDAPVDPARAATNRAEARTVSTITRYYPPTTSGTGGFCAPILHELGHAMGAVQPQAPHYDAGHCNDHGNDVLCRSASAIPYDPEGGRHFDYGNDDYWDPAADPASDSTDKLGWWTVNLSRFLCPPAEPFDAAAPAADCARPNSAAY
jgi:hypothetical protein